MAITRSRASSHPSPRSSLGESGRGTPWRGLNAARRGSEEMMWLIPGVMAKTGEMWPRLFSSDVSVEIRTEKVSFPTQVGG